MVNNNSISNLNTEYERSWKTLQDHKFWSKSDKYCVRYSGFSGLGSVRQVQLYGSVRHVQLGLVGSVRWYS